MHPSESSPLPNPPPAVDVNLDQTATLFAAASPPALDKYDNIFAFRSAHTKREGGLHSVKKKRGKKNNKAGQPLTGVPMRNSKVSVTANPVPGDPFAPQPTGGIAKTPKPISAGTKPPSTRSSTAVPVPDSAVAHEPSLISTLLTATSSGRIYSPPPPQPGRGRPIQHDLIP